MSMPETTKRFAEKALVDVVLPYHPITHSVPGSSDVGDVSWIV